MEIKARDGLSVAGVSVCACPADALLYCKSCERPMFATYSGKRRVCYRYYICKVAQQNGWRSCPTKSLRAALIEDSVVAQLRARLSMDETRLALQISDPAWQAFWKAIGS